MSTAGDRAGGLWALVLVHGTSSAMMRVCDPMLPALAQHFGVTTGQAALTVSCYAVAYGLMQFVFGPLGDRWGKRRVVGYAALACVAGNLLAVAALSLEWLVAARVLAGGAAAGIIALVLAWVGDTVAYENRQAVLARFLTVSLAGMMAGQWLSGVLTEWLGWRVVFALLAALFCVGGAAIARHPHVRAEPGRAGPHRGHFDDILHVLRVPWARWMLLMVAIEGAFAFAAVAFLPAFLVREHGLGLSAAGGLVALYGAGGFVYSFTARRLVPVLGESGFVLVGGIALAVSWVAVVLAPHWIAVVPATLLAGLGFYAMHGVMQTQATQMAPAVRGTAVSLFASGMFGGISIGVAIASSVVDRAGFAPVFLVCAAALGLLGVVFSASLRRQAGATAGGQRAAPGGPRLGG